MSQNREVIKFENSVKSIGYKWPAIGFEEFRRFCFNSGHWKESAFLLQSFQYLMIEILWGLKHLLA